MLTQLSKVMLGISCLVLSSSIALAQNNASLTVRCPGIAGTGTNIVINYITSLAGTGTVRMDSGQLYSVLFQGQIAWGSNIPMDLVAGGYSNSGISYNPSNGVVTCYYQDGKYDPFAIWYALKNGLDGVVLSSNTSEIHLRLPVGIIP